MQIEIYFRDKLLGTGISNGNSVEWEGDKKQIALLVGHYERKGYKGEALLKILAERLQGNTWAQLKE